MYTKSNSFYIELISQIVRNERSLYQQEDYVLTDNKLSLCRLSKLLLKRAGGVMRCVT